MSLNIIANAVRLWPYHCFIHFRNIILDFDMSLKLDIHENYFFVYFHVIGEFESQEFIL